MATTTTADVKLSALPPATGHAGLRGVLASEFTKLRSVRSTYWTIAALMIVGIGLAAALGAGHAADLRNNPGGKVGFDATQQVLVGFFEFGQLVIIVLGALAITSEYSTGMVRTSLTAMPRRGVVYAGKLIAFTTVTLVVSLVTSFIAFFLGQALLSGSGVSASLFHSTTVPAFVSGSSRHPAFAGSIVISQGTVLTAVIGSALFVTVVALIAFGLGAIIRHTAGAITSAIGLMFVLTLVVAFLPGSWRDDIIRFLPFAAGQVISATVGGSGGNEHLWSTWPQFGVTAIYAVVLLAIGAYLFRKRDA